MRKPLSVRGCAVACIAVVVGSSLIACQASPDASAAGKTSIVVGFYPQQFLAEFIGGDKVSVASLAQPGAEPHDLEITPKQVGHVVDADLVLYQKGLQPAVDSAVSQNAVDHALDLSTVTTLKTGYEELDSEGDVTGTTGDGKDPHIWLDYYLMTKMAGAVAQRLEKIDPANASTYQANAADLEGKLQGIDNLYRTGLQTCERRTIVTTHNAFAYLADRYDLVQVGIAGLSPEAEPSPKKLDEVAAYAKKNGITTIFYEESVSPDFAKTIATQVGAKTAILSPIEVAGEGKDYLSLMKDNLAALRTALGCT